MIHSKNRNNGFTFIEVALVLFIMGSFLTSIILLQTTIFTSLGSYSERLNRVLLLTDALFKNHMAYSKGEKDKIKRKETVAEPPTTITLQERKPVRESSLQGFKGILVQEWSAKWDELDSERTEKMVSLVYRPEKLSS